MKKIILIILILIAIIGGVLLFAKQEPQAVQPTQKLSVVSSFYPIYFFASEIGGFKAEVKNLTPPGVEPHDYEPAAKELADLEKSKLLILNGGVEPWGEAIKANLADTPVAIVKTGEGLLSKAIEEEGQKMQDPHIWLDPMLAKEQAKKIANGFITVDPKNQTYYENNLAVLNTKFDQLHATYQTGLQNCQKRDFVTAHLAFAYLASRYGLNQVAISGLSPEAEPSLQEIADISEFARANNITHIFFETLVSPELSQTIAEEIGAQTLVLDPIEGLSEDDIRQGKNYFTVMEKNLKNLQTALQCTR